MASDDVDRKDDHRTPRGVGRRKQFKPVRVLAPEGGREDGGRINGNTLRENNFSTSDERSINSCDFVDGDQLSENCQPILCPDCGSEFQSLDALDFHARSYHQMPNSETSSYPTPYHRLARELQKSTASTQLEKNASKIDMKKLSPDNESSNKLLADDELIKSQDFNDLEAQAVQPLNNQSKVQAEPKLILDETKSPESTELNQNFLERVVEEEMNKKSPVYDVLRNNGSKPPTPNAQQSFPRNPDLLSKFSVSTSVEAEDFCNLCKKHFCNKYYLRKHKQDVHGISSEAAFQTGAMSSDYLGFHATDLKTSISNPGQSNQPISDKLKSSDAQRFTDSLSSIMNGLPFGLPFSSDLPGSLLFPQAIASSSQSGLFNNASTISNLASIMLLNPFVSPLSLLKNSPILQQAQSSSHTPSSLNTLAELQNFGLNSSLLNESNPQNGLMYRFPPSDTAALCDLCQKEFCSTYFLKVHKRDKHGIPLEEFAGQMALKKQTLKATPAPMFSIDGVEPGENITPMSKLRTDDKGLYPYSNKRHEETCFLCKQQFSSRYSLMMHLFSSHNIKPEGFGLASELMQMEMLTNSQVPFSRSSSGSNKTSERVACNICNKEVCNKYFLKTHKLKVHGIQEGQQDPVAPPAYDSSKAQQSLPSNNSSNNPSDPKNLSLDQLMQKYDEIAKQFNTSVQGDFTKKALESKAMEVAGSRKEQELPGKTLPRLYNSIDSSTFLKGVVEKNENYSNMFGTLDLIAKNKLFDGKGSDFQGISNHYGLFDMPQSFKNLGSSMGKCKPSNFSKHLSGKEVKNLEETPAKMSYDPEAYCEICKKEFCSKYFLKTHKQKIHGLRVDGASDSKSPSLTQTSQNSNNSVPLPSDQGMAMFTFDGSSSRNKEPLPSNMTRVTCEICGKELCNKYFLRTHMLKIHGISDDRTRGLSMEMNKQDTIYSSSRKDSPSTDLSSEQLLHQQKIKTSLSKPAELIQAQNLVIGVKELKQVTEMLLQSAENSSSFDQPYEEPKSQMGQFDPRGILTSKDPKFESSTNDAGKPDFREVKLPSISFPSIHSETNDNLRKEESSKVQNFINQNTRRDQFDPQNTRKRRLGSSDDGDLKSIKKFAPNFPEKENDRSGLRPVDQQNRFNSFQSINPPTDSGDFKRTSGKSEASLSGSDNCILQPFELQETSNDSAFAQCKVFLPVVQPICEPITLKFTVTPVDH